jgi:hypothetical protein
MISKIESLQFLRAIALSDLAYCDQPDREVMEGSEYTRSRPSHIGWYATIDRRRMRVLLSGGPACSAMVPEATVSEAC